MNILLLMPKSERVSIARTTYSPPLGLMSIGSSIKKYNAKCSVKLINGELMTGEEELLNIIYEYNADVIGISTNVGCYRAALSLAKKLRKKVRKC